MLLSTRNKVTLLLIALNLTCAAPTVAQESFQISFEEARQRGMQAAQNGDSAVALELANTLLEADDADGVAWYIRAVALFQLGDLGPARAAAQQAYLHAQSSVQRYEAAQLTAIIAYNDDRLTRAQWWLRLAALSAPSDEARAVTERDLADVIRQNPWRTTVFFSVAPSNNVNGGSFDETFRVDGLDTGGILSADAQALDGWTADIRLSTAYRLHSDADSQSFVGARLSWHGVSLSDESEERLRAEDRYEGNDAFSYAYAEVYVETDRALETGTYGYELALGTRWSGGERSENFVRLGADRSIPHGDNALLRFSGFAEKQWDLTDNDFDDRRFGASATYLREFESIGILSGTLSYSETDSEYQNNRSQVWSVYAGYTPAEPVGPFQMSFQIGYQDISFPDYIVFVGIPYEIPGGRSDERIFTSLQAALPDYSFAGFEPVFSIDASTTDSNVSRFEQESVNLGLSFRSSF